MAWLQAGRLKSRTSASVFLTLFYWGYRRCHLRRLDFQWHSGLLVDLHKRSLIEPPFHLRTSGKISTRTPNTPWFSKTKQTHVFAHLFQNTASSLLIVVFLSPVSMMLRTTSILLATLSFLRFVYYLYRTSQLRGKSSKHILSREFPDLQTIIGLRQFTWSLNPLNDFRPIYHTIPLIHDFAHYRRLPYFLELGLSQGIPKTFRK